MYLKRNVSSYFTGKNPETDRRKELVSALENIIQKHPKELEAKAFLAFQLWENEEKGIPITSRESADALMKQEPTAFFFVGVEPGQEK